MTAWIVAIISVIAAVFLTRLYDRREIQRLSEKEGKLDAHNLALRKEVRQLEEALRQAKRPPMDHDDASDRLQELARAAERGVV